MNASWKLNFAEIDLFTTGRFLAPEEEIRAAEEKFEESKEVCYNSMLNLIESSDVSYFKLL